MTQLDEPSVPETVQAGDEPVVADPAKPTEKYKVKKPGRLNDPPDVQLSKLLSYILRHGAVKEQLTLRPDGFVRLDVLMTRPKMKRWTIEDIRRVVDENGKKRFAIVEEQQSDGTAVEFIRANQGHSLSVKDLELKEVHEPSELTVAIHGTYYKFWDLIAVEGLKPMTRTHIHFAKGLPQDDTVISGIRPSSEVFIYLDIEKCRKDKLPLYISPNNGIILTKGFPDSKSIPPEYFRHVVDKEGNVLYPKIPQGETKA